MSFILVINKSIPDVGITLVFLLAFLLILLALNDLFEWLMKKPWKRNGPPEEQVSLDQNEAEDIENGKTAGSHSGEDAKINLPAVITSA